MKKVNVIEKIFPLFTSIAVEIAAKCNRHCHFCPNDYFKRPDEFMSNEMFYNIVAELKSLRYKGRFEFYIYNEPTRDVRLISFIKHVRQNLPSACLMINTNGDYFKNATSIKELFDAGLNQMQINIYSANDASDNEKVFANGVEQARKRERVLNQWVSELKIPNNLSLYQNIGPYKQAVKVIAKYGIKKGHKDYTNRSGLVENFASAIGDPLEKMCTKPFRFLNINWKGDSILCCNDYYGETNFGNVKRNSLVSIWNHPKFNAYRLKLQNKNRNMFLCDKCDFKGGPYPHMINQVTFGSKLDKKILNEEITFSHQPTIKKK